MQQAQLWIFIAVMAALVVCGCIMTRKPKKGR
jgi:outer membrane murein-binding lipoprotein Lpp